MSGNLLHQACVRAECMAGKPEDVRSVTLIRSRQKNIIWAKARVWANPGIGCKCILCRVIVAMAAGALLAWGISWLTGIFCCEYNSRHRLSKLLKQGDFKKCVSGFYIGCGVHCLWYCCYLLRAAEGEAEVEALVQLRPPPRCRLQTYLAHGHGRQPPRLAAPLQWTLPHPE